MLRTAERFSNRIENYVKYRPGYPSAMMGFFRERLGLKMHSVVADIGSGTGLSSEPFLEFGCKVYGVEPNSGMRAAAEKFLSKFADFVSIDGTSAETGLGDASCDLIIAAQAFHWFEPGPTRAEFQRILRPHGHVALIWNERQIDSTEFLKEYEKLLLKYGRDYSEVRHEQIDEAVLRQFFGVEISKATFPNLQEFDLEGLRGRLLSSSYMPDEADPVFPNLEKELAVLFTNHAENGKIKVFYDTNIFYFEL
ncbi:class I SAM-dependent methyltransferase [Leptolyngbya sp. 7M]|uniref:class I SAM-dependent methyltransferase n=1 Tax=Leptolyngbya sp. 7M TaxID=2812896 RepID=UPI001B8C2BE6|nr:class I SAM-dependent methyltransferase [Leptolyngbya sp. 7M]QYO66200.1 class I SAM-dependent methyltransferase [Leptolyngbya sp. 7M]